MSAPARSIDETAMSTSTVWITWVIGRRWTSTSNIERLDRVRVQALRHGQVALRVQVDQQHLVALLGERDAEVQRRRRLRDAALLVRERDHLRLARRGHARRANVGTRKEARETHVKRHFGSVQLIPSASSRSFAAAARARASPSALAHASASRHERPQLAEQLARGPGPPGAPRSARAGRARPSATSLCSSMHRP